MDNPRLIKPGKQALAGLAVSWGLLVILAIALQFMVPAFATVLAAFGVGLPRPTLFTLQFHRIALLLPVAAVLTWAAWPARKSKVFAAVVFCWIAIALIVLMAGTLYLPMLYLGEVV